MAAAYNNYESLDSHCLRGQRDFNMRTHAKKILVVGSLICVSVGVGACASDPVGTPVVDAGPITDSGSFDLSVAMDAMNTDGAIVDMNASLDTSVEDAGELPDGTVLRHLPRGSVTVRSDSHRVPAEGFASAGFIAALPDGPCTVSHPTSACEFLSCASTTSTPADSGDITVSGVAGAGILLFPNVEHIYNISRQDSALWSGGEPITITSLGNSADGQVPAFSTVLSAPGEVHVTAPIFAPLSALSIPRDEDLLVTWTGASAGELVVELSVVDSGIQTLNCRFPVLAGSATIPAEALASLPATTNATFQVRTEDSDLVIAGDWEIKVLTRTVGYSDDDQIAAQVATLE